MGRACGVPPRVPTRGCPRFRARRHGGTKRCFILANGVLSRGRSQRPSQQTTVTLALVAGLAVAFAYATYLSYWAAVSINDAFAYQSAVVAAQRDSELLEVEQFDRNSTSQALRPYEKLLAADLSRIEAIADTQAERAPHFAFPATRDDYERLTAGLSMRQGLGERRFGVALTRNTQTRDLSNAMFAVVALLFAVIVGRLRRAIAEGRSLVERLQRAFIAKRRTIPNVDLGSVLISATRGSNVGGDTFDAFTFEGKRGMFLVADVSGKGIDAAVDTAFVKYTIRTLFWGEADPGTILARFATIYAHSIENPETFVVLFLAVLDLEEGTVRYASAGHEPAWAVLGQDVAQLAATGPIVGIEEHPLYETRELHLRPGDALVVTTDGLTESRDSRGALLGAHAVTVWLSELAGNGAQSMANAIVRRLRRRSSRIADDLAILVIRFAPLGTPREAAAGVVQPSAEPALVSADEE